MAVVENATERAASAQDAGPASKPREHAADEEDRGGAREQRDEAIGRAANG